MLSSIIVAVVVTTVVCVVVGYCSSKGREILDLEDSDNGNWHDEW